MEYNSVYDIRLKMLEKMGGDVTRKYDSIYSIDLAILRLLEEGGGGGEKTYDYLTFTAIETSTITYQPSETATTAQYSYDKVNWETADNVKLSLNKGDKVYFKGEITSEPDMMMGAMFRMSGKIEASGSIMSLQAGDPNDKTLKYNYEFSGLFNYCSSLTTAPELPATTLTDYCYYNMFGFCSNLVTAPAILPATTLANNCYQEMFQSCSSLVNIPELPATTLANYCYYSMFLQCTSLTTAPVLPATTLVTGCYNSMFNSCSSLNYIKALFTTQPSDTYTSSWVSKVPSTGTFVKNSEATWDVTGDNGIPTGWTVETA